MQVSGNREESSTSVHAVRPAAPPAVSLRSISARALEPGCMPGGGGYLCSSRVEDSAMATEYYTHAGDLMVGN